VVGSVTTPAAWRSAQIVWNTVAFKRTLPPAKSDRMPISVFSNVAGLNGNSVRVVPMIAAGHATRVNPSE